MKILLVEDENALVQSLMTALEGQSFVVAQAGTIAAALEKIHLFSYDALVLDIGLPDGSGFEVLKALKAHSPQTGVVILSAKNSLDDKLQGLDWGADDYLAKPFHIAELIARLKALHRRRHLQGRLQIEVNDLSIYPDESTVMHNGEAIPLTPKEFELLLYFASNQERVLTKAAIAEHLWGDMAENYDDFDFIYAHVKNLRKKITEAGAQDFIKTVYGLGYKFVKA
jgi:DNA-binding response OmpR family regulator